MHYKGTRKKIKWGGTLFVLLSLFSSCHTDTEKTEAVLNRFIQRYERHTQKLDMKLRQAYWEMAMASNDTSFNKLIKEQSRFSRQNSYEEVQKKVNHLNHLLDQVHTNQKDLRLLHRIKESHLVKDTLLLQQLDYLYFIYLDGQIPDSVSLEILSQEMGYLKALHSCRIVLDTDTINPFYITEEQGQKWTNARLHKYHKSFADFGDSLRSSLIELIELKNELAHFLGFDNYWNYSLASQYLKEEDVKDWIEKGEEESRKDFYAERQWYDSLASDYFKVPIEALTRDHYPGGLLYNNLFGKIMGLDTLDLDPIKVVTLFYNDMGFRIQEILDKSDLHYRPEKDPHTFLYDLDNHGDVRICSNVQHNINGVKALLHTLGHAFYEKNVSSNVPYLLRAPHQVVTEGIAAYFTNLADNYTWLSHYVYQTSSFTWSEKQNRLIRFQNSWKYRTLMLLTEMERVLYENEDQTLSFFDNHYIELSGKYLGLTIHQEIYPQNWFALRNVIQGGGYVQNYILAEMFASQISNRIGLPLGGETSLKKMRKIHNQLVDRLFKFGASKPWEDLIINLTGCKLSPKYYQRTFLTLN